MVNSHFSFPQKELDFTKFFAIILILWPGNSFAAANWLFPVKQALSVPKDTHLRVWHTAEVRLKQRQKNISINFYPQAFWKYEKIPLLWKASWQEILSDLWQPHNCQSLYWCKYVCNIPTPWSPPPLNELSINWQFLPRICQLSGSQLRVDNTFLDTSFSIYVIPVYFR